MIELKDIRAGYHGQEVLHGISLTFSPERYWPLWGPTAAARAPC